MRTSRTILAAAVALAVGGMMAPAGADHTPWTKSPGIEPPGANDGRCQSANPPVILVHGTYGDMTFSWNLFSPALVEKGYCVWALDLPERATFDLEISMQALTDFIEKVLTTTGAEKVSLIGHSQGGMQIRHVLKHAELGDNALADRVEDAISLAGSHFGTETPLAPLAEEHGDCPACGQQIAGSDFYTDHLNVGDLTPGSASYTQIETRNDIIVTPYTNAFLPEEAGVVTNVLLQEACPHDPSDHIALIYDAMALEWALNALETPGPADPDFVPITCGGGLWSTVPLSSMQPM